MSYPAGLVGAPERGWVVLGGSGLGSVNSAGLEGRPCGIHDDDEELIAATGTTPWASFVARSRWSLSELVDYLATGVTRWTGVGWERLRQLLDRRPVNWQRTRAQRLTSAPS